MNQIVIKAGELYNGAICTLTNDVGVPIDISNIAIKIHFKNDINSNIIAFKWETSDNTIIIEDAAAGKFRIKERIMNYRTGTYYADIMIIDEDDVKITENEYSIIIKNSYTK